MFWLPGLILHERRRDDGKSILSMTLKQNRLSCVVNYVAARAPVFSWPDVTAMVEQYDLLLQTWAAVLHEDLCARASFLAFVI